MLLKLYRPFSTNQMRMSFRGRLVTSTKYRKWKTEAALSFAIDNPATKRVEGRVALAFVIKRPRANADLDNHLKAYIDLLQDVGAIGDDKCVSELSARWGEANTVKITQI